MYVKSTRPSVKREVQKERSAKRDDQIARPRRAQTCELRAKRAMRMCPRSGQIFIIIDISDILNKNLLSFIRTKMFFRVFAMVIPFLFPHSKHYLLRFLLIPRWHNPYFLLFESFRVLENLLGLH